LLPAERDIYTLKMVLTYNKERLIGHYYSEDGKPCHFQTTKTGKNAGKLRPTTITDARKLNLRPSVTGITGVLDAPALTRWLCNQAAERALAKERGEEFVENNSAERGTEIHNAIEDYVIYKDAPAEFTPYYDIVDKVFAEVGVDHPICEATFATDSYGGAVDLSDKEANIIIDYKTKDMDEKKAKGKLAYDNHVMQLAAYRVGLGMPTAKCYNLFLSRDNPTVYQLHEWSEEEMQRGWDMFSHCLAIWRLQNNV